MIFSMCKICWTYLAGQLFPTWMMRLCKTGKAKQSKGYPGISRKSAEPGQQILLGRHSLRRFADTGRECEKKILGFSVGAAAQSRPFVYL